MTLLAISTGLWAFILIPLVIVWLIGVVDIVRSDLSGKATVGWLLVVLLVPLAGTLIYFLTRKPTDSEIRQAQRSADERRNM
jgi:Phospholipase_D-nuclease N-terminal